MYAWLATKLRLSSPVLLRISVRIVFYLFSRMSLSLHPPPLQTQTDLFKGPSQEPLGLHQRRRRNEAAEEAWNEPDEISACRWVIHNCVSCCQCMFMRTDEEFKLPVSWASPNSGETQIMCFLDSSQTLHLWKRSHVLPRTCPASREHRICPPMVWC